MAAIAAGHGAEQVQEGTAAEGNVIAEAQKPADGAASGEVAAQAVGSQQGTNSSQSALGNTQSQNSSQESDTRVGTAATIAGGAQGPGPGLL